MGLGNKQGVQREPRGGWIDREGGGGGGNPQEASREKRRGENPNISFEGGKPSEKSGGSGLEKS